MKKIIKNISIIFQILLNRIILRRPDFSEKRIFLQGQLLDNINKKRTRLKTLKK